MFKVSCVVLALTVAVASVSALQDAANQENAAPEPYAYGYQTDTHAASEQRDPSGKVTGFYTLAAADGRERRVEYEADESGFRAKIATNEAGTKSENPANVEIQASEPTPGQYAYVQSPQVQYQTPAVVVQQPQRAQVQYVQQQPQIVSYGYYPGYTTGGYYGQGYGQNYYGRGYYGAGNYNNHMPSQYYSSLLQQLNMVSPVVGSAYAYNNGNYRYVLQPGVQTTGVRNVIVPQAAGHAASTVGASQRLQGSNNYLVLQKRAAKEEKPASS